MEKKVQSLWFDPPIQTYFAGSVLYYVSNGRAIGMMKKKTIWYILVRSLREKMKAFVNQAAKSSDHQTLILRQKTNVSNTLDQKQRWLGFSDMVLNTWKDIGMKMIDWTYEKVQKNEIQPNMVSESFPLLWKKFLDETSTTDKTDFAKKE
jgi:hypothetical protein